MKFITVEGLHGIKATILADSISKAGVRFVTFEIEYPRLILAELNTHRGLAKNSASSRAIPFKKMLEQLNGRPVRFGEANPGMQDKGSDFDASIEYGKMLGFSHSFKVDAETAWDIAQGFSECASKAFFEAGYHKQVYNRLTEPFQMMKTVISGTEFANFFWLRLDDAADPTIKELARVMREAVDLSKSVLLRPGEWHLPYVDFYQEVIGYTEDDGSIMGPPVYYIGNPITGEGGYEVLSLEDAIKVSCARCAAVSYRNEDYGVEKCRELYERLVGAEKKHASALEHCATPMAETVFNKIESAVNVSPLTSTWEKGVSHMDRNGQLWSGCLRGWVQYRKTIDGENVEGF